MTEHPILPTGYNSSPLGWDNINGTGVTQDATVDFFEGGTVGVPSIYDETAWQDPDIRIRRENRVVKLRFDRRMVKARGV